MNRRMFIANLGFGLLAAPLAAEAQQAGNVPRVGILLLSAASKQTVGDPFREGLRELGYVEGRTIAIEYRLAEGKEERFSDLASELVHLRVDVIFATVAAAVRAAQRATTSIPIVAVVNDPVAAGFVTSVARPGGNVTGLSMMSPEVVGKQLELLREVVPKISRVAVLANPANPGSAPQLRHAEVVAKALGMRLQLLEARSPSEIDSAFAAITKERAGALIVLLDPTLAFPAQRKLIAELAARSRLPTMFALKLHVDAGGLMSYGADIFYLYRRTAIYVDKILKGAKPSDLPIEQATKFELIINLKTAKTLGLTIPPSLLARADQVIE